MYYVVQTINQNQLYNYFLRISYTIYGYQNKFIVIID